MYAHVNNGIIDATAGALPESGRRLDTQQWVSGLPISDVETQRACGWYVVVETAAPTPAVGNTVDRSLQLVGGVPTVVWVERALTLAEVTRNAEVANRSTIVTNLMQDMTDVQLEIDKTNATINANPAATLKVVMKAERRIIRRLLDIYDGTN